VSNFSTNVFLNIVFHAAMGRFQLESKLELPLFSGFTIVPFKIFILLLFLRHLLQVLLSVEVSSIAWLGKLITINSPGRATEEILTLNN
jgi:hypothetical protein